MNFTSFRMHPKELYINVPTYPSSRTTANDAALERNLLISARSAFPETRFERAGPIINRRSTQGTPGRH